MRICHLVDLRFAPWSVLAGVIEALGDDAHEHTVWLLGGMTAARRARDAGVRVDLRIAPPLGNPRAARSVLARAMGSCGRFDVMHAWSAQACLVARDVRVDTEIVASVFEMPASMSARDARAAVGAMRSASATRFGDDATRGAWLDRSDPLMGEVMSGPPRVPDWGAPGGALRRSLGIEDGVGVLVAAGEPGEAIDAMLCMYIVGVLSERGMRATVIVPGDATGLDRAERFSVHHMGKWTVRVSDRPAWELLSIADGVVVADRAPCDGVRRSETILTVAQWGGLLGLPVVAPRVERYAGTLTGDVRWVDVGDRLGFVRAAHRIVGERSGAGIGAVRPGDGAGHGGMYRLCGLAKV